MITKEQLVGIAKKMGIKPYMQEKHYIQSIALSGIYSRLTDELVFKGGTALFFFHGLDRFSEDLDFSSNGTVSMTELKTAIADVFDILNVGCTVQEVSSKAGKNLKIKARGPLHTGDIDLCVVDVEISDRTDMVQKPEARRYTPPYDDVRPFTVPVMNAQEIVAEKIRAILKREKARDVYDLLFLLQKGNRPDWTIVDKKMAYYGEEFDLKAFKSQLMKKRSIWEGELRGLVKTVPPFDEVSSAILKQVQ